MRGWTPLDCRGYSRGISIRVSGSRRRCDLGKPGVSVADVVGFSAKTVELPNLFGHQNEALMTLLYTDERFLDHETGTHRECPERLRAIRDELKRTGLVDRCQAKETRLATIEELLQIHGSLLRE